MESVNTILSNRSYSVRKDSLTAQELKELTQSLTVTPLCNPNFPAPASIKAFEMGKQWIRIPRCFGLEKFGPPDKDRLHHHYVPEENLSFTGTLRENQIGPHSTTLEHLRNENCGILCLQTGAGKLSKTVSA